jgi:hypothetical protein
MLAESARAAVKPVQTWTTASAAMSSMALRRRGILDSLGIIASGNPEM